MTTGTRPLLTSSELDEVLHYVFGYDQFRPLQIEAIDAAQSGQDLLVVMPTGAGKSLCFQLPALITDDVTLVVSPLIALMRDQVDALNRRPIFESFGCAILNSSQTVSEQRDILDRLRQDEIHLLYVAPERFRSAAFLDSLRQISIDRLVVDEAHCISEWGHDFRPDYLSLADLLPSLGNPPVTAVTATATRRVQENIVANLQMRDPQVLVGGFNRPNLHLSVHQCRSESERFERLERTLPALAAGGGSGLIYVATRKQCEEIAELVCEILAPLGRTGGAYHAGLEPDLRTEMQQSWLRGERQVLVCTNAFGMGIDKPDVRFVIHCTCPDSIESYYQEAGRAGRDGRTSRCVILYTYSDRKTREWFIENEALTAEDVQSAHHHIAQNASDGQLPKNWGMQKFRWSEIKSRLAFAELERSGLILRRNETSDQIELRVLQRTFPADALRRITDDLQRRRSERYRRLNEMMDYCKTRHCRRKTILDYFGDTETLVSSPACCDNCAHPPAVPAERPAPAAGSVPMPKTIPPGDLHALLQGLDSVRPALGRSRLGMLLRGSFSKEGVSFQAKNSPLFGVLRGISRLGVYDFFDRLIAEGLLREGDAEDYFVCSVTQAGRTAWQERTPLNIAFPGSHRLISRNSSGAAAEDPDAAFFESLKQWRSQEASDANLPPYCIFSDKTLTAIARYRPADRESLLAVFGVGPAKLEKYGDAVLRVIAEKGKQCF
jgi:ATP-dependent DNA helicase RecQ